MRPVDRACSAFEYNVLSIVSVSRSDSPPAERLSALSPYLDPFSRPARKIRSVRLYCSQRDSSFSLVYHVETPTVRVVSGKGNGLRGTGGAADAGVGRRESGEAPPGFELEKSRHYNMFLFAFVVYFGCFVSNEGVNVCSTRPLLTNSRAIVRERIAHHVTVHSTLARKTASAAPKSPTGTERFMRLYGPTSWRMI